MSNRVKISIVDDQPLFRKGLKIHSFLSEYPRFRLVSEANGGGQFIRSLKKEVPDVVLLDIEKGSEETTQYLRKHYPSIRIVTPSLFNQDVNDCYKVKREIHKFLEKRTLDQFVSEAKQSLRGNGCYLTEFTIKEMLKYLEKNNMIVPEVELSPLTPREKEVVFYVCKGYKNKEIAERLYVSVRTVETYRERIKQKIKGKGTTDLVVYGLRNKLDKSKQRSRTGSKKLI